MNIYVHAIELLWQSSPASSPRLPSTTSTPTALQYLTVILSTVAIVISVLSLWLSSYNQYFKKPEIRIFIADQMETWLTPDSEWVFNISITAFNDGARYAVISRIMGRITSEYFARASFRWRMFIDHRNVSEEGSTFLPFGSFAGWAYSLVIPGRQAVTKTIQFITDQPVNLQAGVYKFEFATFLEDSLDPHSTSRVTFELNDAQVKAFAEARSDPHTRISKKSVRMRQRLQDPSW